MFKEMKHLYNSSVLYKSPKKRKDERIGQCHMLLPKCKLKS